MRCSNCGANMDERAQFCPKCGATVQMNSQQDYRMRQSYQQGYGRGYNNRNNKNDNAIIIAIIIAAGAVLFVTAFLLGFMALAQMGPFAPEPTPTPTPSPTPVVTEAPAPTVQVVYVTQPPQQQQPIQVQIQPPSQVAQPQTGPVSYPAYSRYSSSEYGFAINYPSHFEVYNDGGNITLYTVQSSDASARELIAATSADGQTVSSSLNSYISSHPGSISYKTSGSDYYAVRIQNGGTEYYKYCKFRNGNMYWFEFISPTVYHDIYDGYINDIYNSINIY